LGVASIAVRPLFPQVCIFAYGQTGSGKTHTMEGHADSPGLYVRALQELFRIAAEEGGEGSSWRTSVAMMEVYNDQVGVGVRLRRDLLAEALVRCLCNCPLLKLPCDCRCTTC
jgi:hypothetical protein